MIVYNYNLYILLSKILFYIVSNIKIYDIVQIEKKNERRITKKSLIIIECQINLINEKNHLLRRSTFLKKIL